MGCPGTPQIADREFFKRLSEKASRERIPLSGGIDLTCRCNLWCVHCYAGPQTDIEDLRNREMETGFILDIVDQITDAGCLFLLVTGGEPLLHKDFSLIYRYMKSRGLLVTIFTNGTLIDQQIAELFAELPPYSIEISIYGATEETSEKITGVAGSLARCIRGVRLLLDHGVQHVQLKTILMTLNSHEFYDIENIALDLGLKFRMDAAINPRLNGDKAPLDLRVPPREAVEKECSSLKRLDDMKEYLERSRDLPSSDNLYVCGAGVSSFHIDATGNLMPCLMTTDIKYNLANGSFIDGWKTVINDIIKEKAGAGYQCNGCEKMALCGFCPAFFRLETGAKESPSEYLCAIGSRRYEILNRCDRTGGCYENR
jgi:radical SAM protein with 4Fe4S-binding SPASM domain